jgi:hypothetical protein
LKGEKQDVLKWFKSKHTLKILTTPNSFICLACNDYDIEIDILDTHNSAISYHFPRKITPGLVKFCDIK